MSKSERVEYLGDDVVVTWEGDLCIHVGECGRAQGDLFVREDLAIDGAPEDVPGLKFRAALCRIEEQAVLRWHARGHRL